MRHIAYSIQVFNLNKTAKHKKNENKNENENENS